MSRTSDESSAALAAFEAYYGLGARRSLRKLADQGVSNLRQLEAWSSRYGWAERVLERQQEEILAAREAAKKEAANLARRRLRNAQVMQEAALTIIAKAKITDLDEESARKLMQTASRLLEEGMKAERLELGESTANVSVAPPKPLSEMTDDELAEYIALLEAHAQ